MSKMSFFQRPLYTQPAAIATAVVLLHVGGLVALHNGLLRRAAEIIVQVQMLSELIESPQPVATLPPQPEQATAQPKVTQKSPRPLPLAVTNSAPPPTAPQGISTPASPAPPVEIAQAPAPAPALALALAAAPPAPPAPAKLELPSSDADYLNNPPPAYPPLSKRLGETGKVVVRVYISTDGAAQKAEVRTSSGFERLDAAALAAALKWRYLPGKRAGVAEAMWANVPITFSLNP